MNRHDEPTQLEPWIPFEEDGRVFACRMPIERYAEAVDRVLEAQFGELDPADQRQTALRRTLKALPVLGSVYCYLDEQVVELFQVDSSIATKLLTSVAWLDTDTLEFAVLDLLGEKGQLDEEDILSELSVATDKVAIALKALVELGLVVGKTDGRLVLTKEGFVSWGRSKFGSAPIAGIEKMHEIVMRWQDSLVTVHGLEKEYWFLSNFYEDAPVELDGIRYQNSEAAYQAGRCIGEEEKLKFADLPAAEAKKLAHHGIVTRKDWDEVKVEHMRRVVREKFSQNRALADKLMETRGTLEETNLWGDDFWGDSRTEEDRGHRGLNMLGKVLMDERAHLLDLHRPNDRERACEVHRFRLFEEPWDTIKKGVKNIELRLWDDKRKGLRPGDVIVFERSDGQPGSMSARVEFLDVFPDFEALFRELHSSTRCGFSPGVEPDASRMRRYYNLEELEQCCAVAIGIRPAASR